MLLSSLVYTASAFFEHYKSEYYYLFNIAVQSES